MESVTRPVPTDPFARFADALLEDPSAALADLLTGRFPLGAQQRAEPEDFLADLLVHPDRQGARQVLTERIDQALSHWLLAQIDWELGAVARYGTRAYVAELSDALSVAARLPLAQTARELIDHQVSWDNRLSGLRWPGDIDLWRHFDLVLIQHQPDGRFAPRWFGACERAAWGGPQWRNDLTTGLLGLRKLPHPPGSVPERAVAAALARFALLADARGMAPTQVETMFRRGASALLRLYPRRERHWRDLWSEVVDDLGRAKTQRPMAHRIRDQWLAAVLPGAGAPSRTQPRQAVGAKASRPARFAEPPARFEIDALKRDIQRARGLDTVLWTRIQNFMSRHWAYVDASGDSYFAVRTLHQLATQLFRLAPGRDRLTRIHAWTLRAIELEPENPFPWGLWAQVLDALGESESALGVRWEAIRRFPKDPVLRNELAKRLIRRDQTVIAEDLLRQTMRDFPRDEFCRSMLADLLRETDRFDEAEQILRQAMRDFPRNEVCRNQLAELLREANRPDEAEQLLRQTMRDFPRDEVCRNMLAFLLWQQRRVEEATAVLAEAEAIAPRDPYVQQLVKMIRGESEPAAEYQAEHVLPRPFYLTAPAGDQDGTYDFWTLGEGPTEAESPLPEPASSRSDKEASPHAEPDTVAEADRVATSDAAAPEPSSASTKTTSGSFLALLKSQAPLIQAYFTGTSPAAADRQVRAGTSEVELIAAHRAGQLDDADGRKLLDDWAALRPQSFPARLLLALDPAGTGLDQAALDEIGRDFPDHRRWIDLLRLAFQSADVRRGYVSSLESSRDPQDQRLWDGRIEAVFPGLRSDAERPDVNPDALRHLLEDVALAEAATAVPSLALF